MNNNPFSLLLRLGKIGTFALGFTVLASCTTRPGPSDDVVSDPVVHANSLQCRNAGRFAGSVVGDGHCVSFIKACAGAPNTEHWRPGKKVLSLREQLAPGTIIATFLRDRYPNRTGWHAAIYISHAPDGIWVWDQWRGKPVHKRLIRYRNDNADAGNTAQEYRVVRF